jgi:dipeptidase E|tara:strand:- start:242 stop:1090 length:849 start_codon:yes stop_codon:yes gene_type:complete
MRKGFQFASISLALLFMLSCTRNTDTIGYPTFEQRQQVNALLISGTTNPGQTALEHAREAIAETFGDSKTILLINFASLPEKRDAYLTRMQGLFAEIGPGYEMHSLHDIELDRCAEAVKSAEGFYVSGGNTFLLLRELYDRDVLDLIGERVLGGVPYIGSSAGSNIGGQVIGTTNDFPLVDVPTRLSLGFLPAVFNPHHPDPALDKIQFEARQWKIGEYTRYHENEAVIGVTNPGMLRIRGDEISLVGIGATAFVHSDGEKQVITSTEVGEVSMVLSRSVTR